MVIILTHKYFHWKTFFVILCDFLELFLFPALSNKVWLGGINRLVQVCPHLPHSRGSFPGSILRLVNLFLPIPETNTPSLGSIDVMRNIHITFFSTDRKDICSLHITAPTAPPSHSGDPSQTTTEFYGALTMILWMNPQAAAVFNGSSIGCNPIKQHGDKYLKLPSIVGRLGGINFHTFYRIMKLDRQFLLQTDLKCR